MSKLHVGDVGAILEETLVDDQGPLDLTTATQLDFILRTPTSAVFRVQGVVWGAPTAGVMRYTTVVGDLMQWGQWRYQVEVWLADGTHFHGDAHCFEVGKILEPFPTVFRVDGPVAHAGAPTPARG